MNLSHSTQPDRSGETFEIWLHFEPFSTDRDKLCPKEPYNSRSRKWKENENENTAHCSKARRKDTDPCSTWASPAERRAGRLPSSDWASPAQVSSAERRACLSDRLQTPRVWDGTRVELLRKAAATPLLFLSIPSQASRASPIRFSSSAQWVTDSAAWWMFT